MDIKKIADRAVRIYETSGYGIKESIKMAKKEVLNKDCKNKLELNFKEMFLNW